MAEATGGPRLVAFFAVMYYAGLRPEEAINLSADNIILPPRTWDAERPLWQDPPEDGEWGELHLRTATPRCGQRLDRRRQLPGTQAAQAPGRG